MQRAFDIIISLLALIFLFPFLLPIMAILKLTGEREIFYVQQRAGHKGKQFGLLKFATMLKDSPNIGAGDITVKDDPRVLPFGKFLRKTKINELPQLWNVFIGDMSIVGPRPMVPKTYSKYPEFAQKKLDTIRPGLTGVGSIFFRDEEKYLAKKVQPMKFYNEEIIPYKSDLEIWYVDNNSIWLYIKVIFVTAWVIIFPSSKIPYRAFKGIPDSPDSLKIYNK